MKIVRGIFFTVMALIMAGCLGIIVCAMNPSLTGRLAEMLNGKKPANDLLSGFLGGGTPGTIQTGGTGSGLPGGIGGGGFLPSIGVPGGEGSTGTGGSQPDSTGTGLAADTRPGVNASWLEGRDTASYEVPAARPEVVPDSVAGRNGYEAVQEDAEEIAPEEADVLPGSGESGETGSGLSFNGEQYPYYAMLEADMQKLYCQIYANAMEQRREAFAPAVQVSVKQLKSVFEAVYNDHPELFWLQTGYSCKYVHSGNCLEITLKYNKTVDNLQAARQEFDAAAEKILAEARTKGSDLEKEKYVHDVLMEAAEYDLSADMSQSAYSALVQGRSVCAGYARAFQYLMQQLGIPCYYCTGYAGEDHAWNIVKLDGRYVNVDVTWDDTDPPTSDYFNKSDREFSRTHVRTGLSVYLPACVDAGEGTAQGGNAVSGVQTGTGNSGGAQTDNATGNQTGTGEETDQTSSVAGLINPNPSEPLTWQSKYWTGDADLDEDMSAEEKKQENLDQAGITEEEVRETLEECYEDCKKLLKEAGTGQKQFSNVIPESLWSSLERAYSSGEYWNGYVEGTLQEMGVENFLIQLQAQRLGGGYYRLYHNVLTY